MTNKVEILAPCGTEDSFYAAINSGCDACYLAGDMFGARAYAGNFSKDKLIEAIWHAHQKDVRVYMTVNTLLKNQEMDKLYEYILPYYLNGLDAVIVQDAGVMSVIKTFFPDLKIHCSTQMNIVSYNGAAYAKSIGADRIVTAREMSLDEIKKIKNKVDIEVETFVHGAMCFCYSGRCLLSSFAGGRSGNRGRCAQPCRKKYNGLYDMSMKDMCSLVHVPKLIEAGIDSFKIEGRMKNEYYVAACVDAYKNMVSDYYAGVFSEKRALKYQERLADIFNRGGFFDGYFFMRNGHQMIDNKTPGRKGVCVGSIEKITNGQISFRAKKDIYKYDMLTISVKEGDSIQLTSNVDCKAGNVIILNAKRTKELRKNTEIYRTKCDKLIKELENNLINDEKKVLVSGEVYVKAGTQLKLDVTASIFDKTISVSVSGKMVDEATNKAITDEVISNKIKKLGNTCYEFKALKIHNDNNSFVPVSEINNIRRNAFLLLDEKIKSEFCRSIPSIIELKSKDYASIKLGDKKSERKLRVQVNSIEQADAAIYVCADKSIIDSMYIEYAAISDAEIIELINRLRNKNIKALLCLPQIIRQDNLLNTENLNKIINMCDGIYIRNICELQYVIENNLVEDKEIILGNSLYAYNNEAIKYYYFEIINKTNAKNITFDLPRELNKKELMDLKYPINADEEMKIYGKEELMVTAQCMYSNTNEKCCKTSYDKPNVYKMSDDLNNPFISVSFCKLCYNVIYNGLATSLHNYLSDFSHVRLAFTDENRDEVKDILYGFISAFDGEKFNPSYKYTTGHLSRGIE